MASFKRRIESSSVTVFSKSVTPNKLLAALRFICSKFSTAFIMLNLFLTTPAASLNINLTWSTSTESWTGKSVGLLSIERVSVAFFSLIFSAANLAMQIPSSNEFEANLFAPCKPELAHSPIAYSPSTVDIPNSSVKIPPHE